MCNSCMMAQPHTTQGHNNFSYFYRRRCSSDTDRKAFYVGLLDEIAGSEPELAAKFSTYIADIHAAYADRLHEWLQHPLERLKLKEAFRYFLAESSAQGCDRAAAAAVLERLTQDLPLPIVDELLACVQDMRVRRHSSGETYLRTLRRRSYASSRTTSLSCHETEV